MQQQVVNNAGRFNGTKLLICTPCYGGMITSQTVTSLVGTSNVLFNYGIGHTMFFMGNESLLQRGRNSCVQMFRAHPGYTHLLFVDADVSFNPHAIVQLLSRNKEVVGGVYPDKHYRFDRVIPMQSNKSRLTPEEVTNLLADFPIEAADDPPVIEEELLRVKQIHAGLLLIKKSAIEKVIKAHPEYIYHIRPDEVRAEYIRDIHDPVAQRYPEDNYCTTELYAVFDCITHEDKFLAEDHGFCARFRDLGGEIYADLAIKAKHTGTNTFSGEPMFAFYRSRYSSEEHVFGKADPEPIRPHKVSVKDDAKDRMPDPKYIIAAS